MKNFINYIKNIFNPKNIWIPIYQNNFKKDNNTKSFFLTFTDDKKNSLKCAKWDYLFGTYYNKARGDNGPDVHYLTILRHGNSNLNFVELSDEFRLFYNLYKEENDYYMSENDVEPQKVIRYREETGCFEIKYEYLVEYLAYKKFFAVLNFEVDFYEYETKLKSNSYVSDNYCFERRIFKLNNNDKKNCYLIRYLGKVILDFKTLDAKEKEVSFLVGKTNKNKNKYETIKGFCISSDCYVCFDRQVLKKYIDKPSKYKVGFSSVCSDYWCLNNQGKESYNEIFVSLHSLSYIPYEEQVYWSKFAKIPEDTKFFTKEIHMVDKLKSEYENFNYYWNIKHSEKIFKELTGDDKYKLKQIYVPLNEEFSEFNSIITNICICFVDCINNTYIRKLTPNEFIVKDNNGKIPNSTRLALKDYFNYVSVDFEKYDVFLKYLIALRNNATHPKSEDFVNAKEYFEIEKIGYKKCITNIAKTLLDMMKLFVYFY